MSQPEYASSRLTDFPQRQQNRGCIDRPAVDPVKPQEKS